MERISSNDIQPKIIITWYVHVDVNVYHYVIIMHLTYALHLFQY